MKLATRAASSRRDAAVSSNDHQSHKSGGTESTENDGCVADPAGAATAAAVFAPGRDDSLLDQALARNGSDGSDASPPPPSTSGGWRQKFGLKKWRGGSKNNNNNNNRNHRRSKSADASSTTVVPPWLAHVEVVSLADSQTIVASPNASKQATELFKAASRDEEDSQTSQRKDEQEANEATTGDETALEGDYADPAAAHPDRVTIDFRELSQEDAAKLLPILEMKAGKRPSETHSEQKEGTIEEKTAGATAASANKEATMFERIMANATCGQCNCAEETEKGVEMIAVNDSLLDDTDEEEEEEEEDDEGDEQHASVADVEVSLESRKKLWRKNLWSQKAGDSAGGMVIFPGDNEAQEEQQQPKQYDEDELDALADRMATPPRSPPKLKRQGSKIVADLAEGPPKEAEGKGLEVIADLSPIRLRVDSPSTNSPFTDAETEQIPTLTPPRRSKLDPRCFIDVKSKMEDEDAADDKGSIMTQLRSRSSETPFTNAETEVVNNLTPPHRSKLEPRCFIEAKPKKKAKDTADSDDSITAAPSEIIVEQKNLPVIERRLEKRSPSMEYLEERCNRNIVLTTSPFRTQSTMAALSSLASDQKTEDPVKAKVRANIDTMRSIAAQSQDGDWEEYKRGGTSKHYHDKKSTPANSLTPRRSNLGLDEMERVRRNVSRMRSIAGLTDIPINSSSSSAGNDTQKKPTRSDILKSSPFPRRSIPHREPRSTGSTKSPVKLQDYIRGHYSKFDEYERMSIEQVYKEHEDHHADEEHYAQEDHEDRDAAEDSDGDDVKMLQFAEQIEESSLQTQDVSPMNLRSFLKPRGRSINFQALRLRNKFRSHGKQPSRDADPLPHRSTSSRSLYDLRRTPGSMEDHVMDGPKDDADENEVEITMTLDEDDDSRFEDDTLGDTTFGSDLQLLATVPVAAHRSASSRRPWRRLRSLGGKVHP